MVCKWLHRTDKIDYKVGDVTSCYDTRDVMQEHFGPCIVTMQRDITKFYPCVQAFSTCFHPYAAEYAAAECRGHPLLSTPLSPFLAATISRHHSFDDAWQPCTFWKLNSNSYITNQKGCQEYFKISSLFLLALSWQGFCRTYLFEMSLP